MQRVALSGSFDGDLHIGHLNLFKRVKDILNPEHTLTVFIAQDSIIRVHKQREPIYSQTIRGNNISKILKDIKHEIHLFSECEYHNFNTVVNLFNLSLYIFGEDQLTYRDTKIWTKKLKQELESRNIQTLVLPRTKNVSTTEIINSNKLKI